MKSMGILSSIPSISFPIWHTFISPPMEANTLQVTPKSGLHKTNLWWPVEGVWHA